MVVSQARITLELVSRQRSLGARRRGSFLHQLEPIDVEQTEIIQALESLLAELKANTQGV